MRSELFASNMLAPTDQIFSTLNGKTCRVKLANTAVLAKAGSMVSYDGYIQFAWERPNLEQALVETYTKEGMYLMRCSGQGDLFLAHAARDVHLVYLENEGLTINGKNVLAFEPTIGWTVAMLQAPMTIGNHGMFNVVLQGTGWVAITSVGPPIVMPVTPQSRVFVDPDAIIGWSATLRLAFESAVVLTSAWNPPNRGTGEELQLRVEGPGGYVLVQPSEQQRRRPKKNAGGGQR